VAVRSPLLHEALRGFCLGAFVLFGRELEEGGDLPFAFEEHSARGRPALYEYRPLVRDFVEARASRLAARDDAGHALDELAREPAARIFARAHAGSEPDERRALVLSVLVPLLVRTAEACGGFDWDDRARPRVRDGVRGARAVALRRRARLRGGRTARRAVGPCAGRAGRRHARPRRGDR